MDQWVNLNDADAIAFERDPFEFLQFLKDDDPPPAVDWTTLFSGLPSTQWPEPVID
ncbi:hypothetical protein EMMF5_006613, partial [Cystobasidiomycetes sp. EMM_F5]